MSRNLAKALVNAGSCDTDDTQRVGRDILAIQRMHRFFC